MTALRRKVRLGFGLALALLLALSAASYFSASQSVVTFQTTARTQLILAKLEEVLRCMLDVETGCRGFVATGMDSFLEPFNTGSALSQKRLQELRSLLAASPDQEGRLTRLETLVNR
jgi:methyl-accepting chemotaxis protein